MVWRERARPNELKKFRGIARGRAVAAAAGV